MKSANYCKFQSAYRKGHSTETALLRVVNDIQRAAGNGQCTALLALDISSAFDAVDHATLTDRARTASTTSPWIGFAASEPYQDWSCGFWYKSAAVSSQQVTGRLGRRSSRAVHWRRQAAWSDARLNSVFWQARYRRHSLLSLSHLVRGLREVLCAIICPLILTLVSCRAHGRFKKNLGRHSRCGAERCNSRWRPRWPPHPYIQYNSICICLGVMNLVSLPKFLGSRNPFKSFSGWKK